MELEQCIKINNLLRPEADELGGCVKICAYKI